MTDVHNWFNSSNYYKKIDFFTKKNLFITGKSYEHEDLKIYFADNDPDTITDTCADSFSSVDMKIQRLWLKLVKWKQESLFNKQVQKHIQLIYFNNFKISMILFKKWLLKSIYYIVRIWLRSFYFIGLQC